MTDVVEEKAIQEYTETQFYEAYPIRTNGKKYQIYLDYPFVQKIQCPIGLEFKLYENDICIAESTNGLIEFKTLEEKDRFEEYLKKKICHKDFNGETYHIAFNEFYSESKVNVIFTFVNVLVKTSKLGNFHNNLLFYVT